MSLWISRFRSRRSPADSKSAAAPRPNKRTWPSDALHLAVLSSFAIAQPVYDRLGHQHAFLADQNVTPASMGLFVFLLSFAIPAGIALIELLVVRWKRGLQDVPHAIAVFVFLVLIALSFGSQLEFLPGFVVIFASLAASGVGLWSYFEFPACRVVVTWAAPGILIFPGVFLSQYATAIATVGSSSIRSERWEPAPIILLVFDELCGSTLMTPAREIDADRFPNFAALAKRSTWFRNASSVNPLTQFAVPAILSGKYPVSEYSPSPVELPQNLFSTLTNAGGYELAAFEPVTNLAPRSLAKTGHRPTGVWQQSLLLADILSRVYLFQISPSDYRVHLPKIPQTWFGWNDSRLIDRRQTRGRFSYGWSDRRDDQFQHFLNCVDDSPRPVLYFGHFLLPHMPWCYLPSGNHHTEDSEQLGMSCLETDGPGVNESERDEFVVAQSQQRYLLQLMYVDHLVGQLLARLQQTGVLDRCLLVVTADHGISFRKGLPRRWLIPGTQDDVLSIPLFVKRPYQTTGEISDRAVESVDILPTIADVIGLKLQAPTDGWSVFDTSRPERKHLTVIEGRKAKQFDPQMFKVSKTPDVLRQRFGKGSDLEAMYRIGPMPELIGQSLRNLKQSSQPRVEIEALRYGTEVADAPKAEWPCYFSGTILSPSSADKPVVLAIAINGTIHAVTRADQQFGSGARWSAMVPEWAFHVGHNDVQIYSVSGTDRRLVPCIVSDRPN